MIDYFVIERMRSMETIKHYDNEVGFLNGGISLLTHQLRHARYLLFFLAYESTRVDKTKGRSVVLDERVIAITGYPGSILNNSYAALRKCIE